MAVNFEIMKELVESVVVIVTPVAGVSTSISPDDLSIDWRIEFEERAAILEYDGGLSREMADVQALQEIAERIQDAERI